MPITFRLLELEAGRKAVNPNQLSACNFAEDSKTQPSYFIA